MKPKKKIEMWKIVLGLIGILLIAVIAFPFFKPIRVTWSSLPYIYTIHGTYIEINKYTGTEEDVIIPDTICFRPVRVLKTTWTINLGSGLENETVFGNSTVRSVYIPDSVEEIDECCFEECANLEEVRLSPNIKQITYFAFGRCSSLERIVIPEGIECIDSMAFAKCTGLKEIVLPQSLREIGSNAFFQCEQLSYVDIPESVEKIEGESFEETAYETTWVEEFVIKGKNVLLRYNGADEIVEIPEGVEYVGRYVFPRNSTMKVLIFPESVKECIFVGLWDSIELEYVVVKNPNMIFPEDTIGGEDDKIIFVGEAGSTTEAYAKEMGYEFRTSLPEEYADYE